MEYVELAESFNREQQNAAIRLIAEDFEVLKQACIDDLIRPDRSPIPLSVEGRKATAIELARSIDNQWIGHTIVALIVNPSEFSRYIAFSLVQRTDKFINKPALKTTPWESVLDSLYPLEIALHLYFNAAFSALTNFYAEPQSIEICIACIENKFSPTFIPLKTTLE